MSTPDDISVEELFHAALALEGTAREQLLATSEKNDPQLVAEVRSLIAAHAGLDGFLGDAVPDLLRANRWLGQRLGGYELTREIGSGGMGVVYLARRVDGTYEQHVAIKLIRSDLLLGLGAAERRDILQRFHAERRLLARLSHPNIARLLDAGSAADGTPYLVMEYVPGEPIHEYCASHEVSLATRITLAVTIARAVQHAHANLIAHRDLKPSNILIAQLPEANLPCPKLLDFGIAKLLVAEGGGDGETATVTIARRLSPAYASPEQFRGDPATAASDVYSLGVVFFELFTGRLPYQLAGLSPHEVARRICEDAPALPSACDRRVRGDLEVVLLKALAKQPQHRYATAGALADDLDRILTGHPIAARRASALHQFVKLLSRHKVTAAFAFVLAAGAVGSSITFRHLYREARSSSEEATVKRREAEAVAGLFESMFASPDPYLARGQDARVVDVLDGALPRVLESLDSQPRVRAALEHMAGKTYHGLGRHERAAALLGAATEHYGAGLDEHRLVDLKLSLGAVFLDEDQNERAAAMFEAVRTLEQSAGREQSEPALQALACLGLIANNRGDYGAAVASLRSAWEGLKQVLGEDHDRTLEAELWLGQVLQESGAWREAEPLLAQVSEAHNRLLGRDHLKSIEAASAYADLLTLTARAPAAEAILRPLLEIQRRAAGDQHKVTLTIEGLLARALYFQGKLAAAAEMQRHVAALQRDVLGPSHRDTLTSMSGLALTLDDLGALAEAESLNREILELQRTAFGDDHPHVLITMGNLAHVLRRTGKREESEELFLEAIDRAQERGADTNGTRLTYAEGLLADRRFADAESQLVAAESEVRAAQPVRRDRLRRVLAALVRLHLEQQDRARAEPFQRELRALEQEPAESAAR